MFVVKTFLAAILPVIVLGYGAYNTFDQQCVDSNGGPISSDAFEVQGDSSKFYQCSQGYLLTKKCEEDTVFNPVLKVCDQPANVPGCGIFTVLACENDHNIKASCPPGEVIVVRDGFYGRDEGSSCPHHSIKTTQCSAVGSQAILKKACNGKNSCTLEPTNKVFGDPCVNTYKFIKMNYFCQRDQEIFTALACENDLNIKASCPPGEVIVVKHGFYGRDEGSSCPHHSIKTTQCSAVGSLAILRKACNGKNSCTLEPTNKVFGDPCVNTYKFIKMNYYCQRGEVSPRSNRVTVCEGKRRTLTCPAGTVIWVKKGYYGRGDSTTCSHTSIRTTTCSADTSLDRLRTTCNGKNSCVVQSSNSVFGDPCGGTYKYVDMTYLCRTKTQKLKKITVCEGKIQSLSCPAGSVIRIKNGYYGRRNRKTCPHSSIKTTTCSADKSLDKLRNACEGKNSCDVKSNNSVFGDPCGGTYKYVEMKYLCEREN